MSKDYSGITAETAVAVGIHGGNFMMDGERLYLAMPKGEFFPHVNCDPTLSEPAFPGMPEEYIKSLPEEIQEKVRAQLRNKIRKCPCGKAVAYISKNCNLCGSSMENVPISFSDNVFMEFIYGIRGSVERPLKLSLRYQTPELMAFDDLLSVSTCHFVVIPTNEYIPDWRFLLRRPHEGLDLIHKFIDCCKKVFEEQFMSNKAWVERNVPPQLTSLDEIYDYVEMGFNFPPSQFQLHMHFVYPQQLPFQSNMTMHNEPVMPSELRYLPTQYVQTALEKIIETGNEQEFADLNEDADFNAITGRIKELFGLDKFDFYRKYYFDNYESNGDLFGKVWKAEEFEGYGIGDKIYKWGETTPVEGLNRRGAAALEKKALGNYGRPLNEDGSFFGTYYKYAKKPSEVGSFFLPDK